MSDTALLEAPSTTALRMKDVLLTFPDGEGRVTAVDHVDFTVPQGQMTGFVGGNGAGKTTTMRMIMGLDKPTSGKVTINGRPYRQLSAPLCEVGALLDAKGLHGSRSARSHLRQLAASNGIPAKRVDEVLDELNLA